MDELAELTAQMFLGPPVHVDTVKRIERHLGVSFCPHYVRFVTEIGDGGAGEIGEAGWLDLFGVGSLPRAQAEYERLSPYAAFGGGDSGEVFVFDVAGTVLAVPAPDDAGTAHRQGDFGEFLRRLAAGRLFE
jgi:hypothetical protein